MADIAKIKPLIGSQKYRAIKGEYEPGSDDLVLRNKLGITYPDEMDKLEFDLLSDLQSQLVDEVEIDQIFNNRDLSNWHGRWLSGVYEWGGQYRTVNVSKDGFLFAAADQIRRLMTEYEQACLHKWTPCKGLSRLELVRALAECHVEFIIIHPFRDGNGRLSRVLATLMALQAGYPQLDFSVLESDRSSYIAAIHSGHIGNYKPMIRIFSDVLDRSLAEL